MMPKEWVRSRNFYSLLLKQINILFIICKMLDLYDKYIIIILSILAILMSIAIYVMYNYEVMPESELHYEPFELVG